MRIGIVFDDHIRPDTTGIYCLKALRQLAEVTHFRLQELASLEGEGLDLIVHIDDGLRYRLPETRCPRVFWAIDTHLDLAWYQEKAPDFDLVCVAQRDAVSELRNAGVKIVDWLPLACDPSVHRDWKTSREDDLCFVGNVFPGDRAEMLQRVRSRFPKLLVGQYFFDEMAQIYSRHKIGLNRSIRNDVNMRVFEVMACGALLMTNDLAAYGLSELFQDGVHCVTYADYEELIDKLQFYLKYDAVRERVARQGTQEVTARHTYLDRMQRLLSLADSHHLIRRNPSHAAVSDLRAMENKQAEPRALRDGGTSVIIPVHNQIEWTRHCLESLRLHTPEPLEIIVIDNGSTDGTNEYLKLQDDVHVITNELNLGFPKACNQGLRYAHGEQLLLLNNDVVVTPGWLTGLLRALHSSPDIGLVGPCSNQVSGEQKVPTNYSNLDDLASFARRWTESHCGHRQEVSRLVGFCLLMRRCVVETIGWLDERFGLGNFEDDDYCRRAILAGFRCLIARDVFVHHEGHTTFKSLPVDFGGLLRANELAFNDKWRDPRPFMSAAESESDPSAKKKVVLSLCMIVRDAERTLPACLTSIKPWVDEMVIVDTGSHDKTVDIAKSFGARVFEFAWPDSFAVARNESLRHARGEWLFWMDADDTISKSNGQQLRDLAYSTHADQILGVVMQVHCPGPRDTNDESMTVVDHVKLIRNRPELRFEYRIHEQILPAIRRAGGDVSWTQIHVVHSGADLTPEGRQRKWARDLRLLELELQDHPGHPFALFNLGMTLADMGKHAAAIDALAQSFAASAPGDSHVPKLCALWIASLCALGDFEQAEERCATARQLFPQDPELLFRQASLHQRAGRHVEAESLYLDLVSSNGKQFQFSSIDRGILGYKAHHNLALIYTNLQQLRDAERHWWSALDSEPKFLAAWRGLGENLIQQERFQAVESLCQQLGSLHKLPQEGVFLAAKMAKARGETAKATCLYRQALQAAPLDTEILRGWCQHVFHFGAAMDAAQALCRLTELEPNDPSAHHNLGIVYMRLGQPSKAEQSFARAIELRPEFEESHTLLQLATTARSPDGELQPHRLEESHSTGEDACGQRKNPFALEHAPSGGLLLRRKT